MTNIHVPSQLDQLSKKELLEYVHIMHKENIIMAKEIGILKADLEFTLEQSIIIEYRQDHGKLRELRIKYGLEF